MKPVWSEAAQAKFTRTYEFKCSPGCCRKTGLQKPEPEMKPEVHLTFKWKDEQLKSAYCLQLSNARKELWNECDINEWRKKAALVLLRLLSWWIKYSAAYIFHEDEKDALSLSFTRAFPPVLDE